MLQQVKFVLMVKDMHRATQFYRDVIGLKVACESSHWTELKFGDAVVALHAGGSAERTETGLSFQVSDVAAVCQRVAQGGGTIVKNPESRPGEPIKLAAAADT
ncbi:MAG: VOC family protein, partial [Pirellulales bacterium]